MNISMVCLVLLQLIITAFVLKLWKNLLSSSQREAQAELSKIFYSLPPSSVQLSMADIISPTTVEMLCTGSIKSVQFHSAESCSLLDPINQSTFNAVEFSCLECIYQFLYDSDYTITYLLGVTIPLQMHHIIIIDLTLINHWQTNHHIFMHIGLMKVASSPMLGKITRFVSHTVDITYEDENLKHT